MIRVSRLCGVSSGPSMIRMRFRGVFCDVEAMMIRIRLWGRIWGGGGAVCYFYRGFMVRIRLWSILCERLEYGLRFYFAIEYRGLDN